MKIGGEKKVHNQVGSVIRDLLFRQSIGFKLLLASFHMKIG
jgi:hypothetical protein